MSRHVPTLLGVWLTIGCNVVLPLGPPGADPQVGADGRADGPWPDQPATDVSPETSCPRYERALLAAEDDGELAHNDDGVAAWYPEGEDPESRGYPYPEALYLGHWIGGPTWSYFRFALPGALDPGRIVRGRLGLFGVGETAGWSAGENALLVHGELADDAAVVSGVQDMPGTTNGRVLTTSAVRWPPSGPLIWTQGATNSSPDLAPIIDEVVSKQGGLAQGAHLQLWVRGEQANVAEVGARAFEKALDPAERARLTLEICP